MSFSDNSVEKMEVCTILSRRKECEKQRERNSHFETQILRPHFLSAHRIPNFWWSRITLRAEWKFRYTGEKKAFLTKWVFLPFFFRFHFLRRLLIYAKWAKEWEKKSYIMEKLFPRINFSLKFLRHMAK